MTLIVNKVELSSREYLLHRGNREDRRGQREAAPPRHADGDRLPDRVEPRPAGSVLSGDTRLPAGLEKGRNSRGSGAGGADLLQLVEVPGSAAGAENDGAVPFRGALSQPSELARAVGRLFQLEYENYPTDHVITKTTYLRDPEGQEIELYAESPEDGAMGIAEGLPFARRSDGRPSDGRTPWTWMRFFGS